VRATSEQVHRRSVAACGAVKQARFLTHMQGGCTQNTRMGRGLPPPYGSRGWIKYFMRLFAVNEPAELRPIGVFCVHPPASA
jgi:hypothetical protein